MSAFFGELLAPKTTKLAFGFEILTLKISYQKRMRKTLMTLTPAENFTFCFRHKQKKYDLTLVAKTT
jgi:hypothetical protein